MTVHINRTISDVYPVDSAESTGQGDEDQRMTRAMERRQLIRQIESDQARVAAWDFDD